MVKSTVMDKIPKGNTLIFKYSTYLKTQCGTSWWKSLCLKIISIRSAVSIQCWLLTVRQTDRYRPTTNTALAYRRTGKIYLHLPKLESDPGVLFLRYGASDYCLFVQFVVYIGRLPACLLDVLAGDHVLLESQDFACVYNPKQITIRTRASEKESFDSAPVTLTPELLAEIRYRVRHLTCLHFALLSVLSDVCWRRICLRDTSACSALEVDNFMRYINLLSYLLTYSLLDNCPFKTRVYRIVIRDRK